MISRTPVLAEMEAKAILRRHNFESMLLSRVTFKGPCSCLGDFEGGYQSVTRQERGRLLHVVEN